MISYRELESEYDRIPDEFLEKLITSKRDIILDINERMNRILGGAIDDYWHSAKYYSLLKELIISFRSKVSRTILPEYLQDWWRYSYEISHKGICLYVEHIRSIWENEQTGELDEETIDQVFPLISVEAKMLTVDEYANLYGVEQVTVRQWIRRGKLREAEKCGKEWRISELTDVPHKNEHRQASYKWISSLKELPAEFEFLNNYSKIEIEKSGEKSTNNDSKIMYYAFLSSMADRYDKGVKIDLTDEQCKKLESYLIANPDVLYIGNTKTFCYKCERYEFDIDEEEDDE